jgi:hypothetical protein
MQTSSFSEAGWSGAHWQVFASDNAVFRGNFLSLAEAGSFQGVVGLNHVT